MDGLQRFAEAGSRWGDGAAVIDGENEGTLRDVTYTSAQKKRLTKEWSQIASVPFRRDGREEDLFCVLEADLIASGLLKPEIFANNPEHQPDRILPRCAPSCFSRSMPDY